MRPGLLPLLSGIALIITAIIIAPAFLVWRALQLQDEAVRFLGPGSVTTPLSGPGSYLLSHDYLTQFEGRSYRHHPALPPGLQIEFINPATNAKLPFVDDPSFASGTDSETHTSRSLARLELEDPAPAQIEIRILGESEPHVFSFQRNPLGMIVGIFVKAGIIAVGVGMTGLLSLILGIRKLGSSPPGSLS